MSPIGIFDSGVGGLTVVKSLRRSLPDELLCYFGDTARVPYGTKSAETVRRYSAEITHFLMSHNVKLIVVACNTASAVALNIIRETTPLPVLGVVEPGVKAALNATRNGRIGVIGTKSTINSQAYQSGLRIQDPNLHIFGKACPLFVPLVEEEGWASDSITLQVAERYLHSLKDENLDTLILGCTHYPLLADVIQQVMGESVTLVSSAEEVSKEVASILRQSESLSPQRSKKDLFYASDDIGGFQRMYHRIFGNDSASFVDAPSDFSEIVQKVHCFKSAIFSDPMTWFEALD